MCLHMRGLHLWDFLMGELPCPSSPSAPAQPVISEKTTAAEKEQLLADYKDRLASYESQFHAYMTWLDEDSHAGSVLTASMEDRFAVDIMDFEQTHQMWSFIYQKYGSTGQSNYLAAIHQEQLLRQGTIQLRISLISFLLFGASLTLLALSYPLPPVSPAEIRQLHLSFIGPTTF
jgi:hypothetical protein